MIPRRLGLHHSIPHFLRNRQAIRVRQVTNGAGGDIAPVIPMGEDKSPTETTALPHGLGRVFLYYLRALEDNIVYHDKIRLEAQSLRGNSGQLIESSEAVDAQITRVGGEEIGIGKREEFGGSELPYDPESYFGMSYRDGLLSNWDNVVNFGFDGHTNKSNQLMNSPVRRITNTPSRHISYHGSSPDPPQLKDLAAPSPQEKSQNAGSSESAHARLATRDSATGSINRSPHSPPQTSTPLASKEPSQPRTYCHLVDLPIPPETNAPPLQIPKTWNLPGLSSPAPLQTTSLPLPVHKPIPLPSTTSDQSGSFIPRIWTSNSLHLPEATLLETPLPSFQFAHLVESPIADKSHPNPLLIPIITYLQSGADVESLTSTSTTTLHSHALLVPNIPSEISPSTPNITNPQSQPSEDEPTPPSPPQPVPQSRQMPQLPTHLLRRYYHLLETMATSSKIPIAITDTHTHKQRTAAAQGPSHTFDNSYRSSLQSQLDLGFKLSLVDGSGLVDDDSSECLGVAEPGAETTHEAEMGVEVGEGAQEEAEVEKALRLKVFNPLLDYLKEDVQQIRSPNKGPTVDEEKAHVELLQEKILAVQKKLDSHTRNQFWWKRLQDPAVIAQGIPASFAESQKFTPKYGYKKEAIRKKRR